MIKNEEINKGIERIRSNDIAHNNSNEFRPMSPTSLQKRIRKDAKGNLILKKNSPIKKTKHHAYLVDAINPEKKIVNVQEIESYKQYNLEEEEIEENEKEGEEKLEESNVITSQGCCIIF